MDFKDFIKNLDKTEKENFNKFSELRSKQVYKIIYDALIKHKIQFTYNDINSLVRYDKEIKNILYKYLAIAEELVRTYLFNNYDLKDPNKKVISNNIFKKEVNFAEVTSLYIKYKLTFNELIKLLKKLNDNNFNYKNLYEVNKLRNKVMHHYQLLFDFKSNSLKQELEKEINALIFLLPKRYVENNNTGIVYELKKLSNATNINTNNKLFDIIIDIKNLKGDYYV